MDSNEWKVPMPPEQRAAGAVRRRRTVWGILGGLLGLVVNSLVLTLFLATEVANRESTDSDTAYAGVAVILYTGLASAALLITGGLLCIWRRARPFGVGMLIGTAVGLICSNGVCFAVVAMVS